MICTSCAITVALALATPPRQDIAMPIKDPPPPNDMSKQPTPLRTNPHPQAHGTVKLPRPMAERWPFLTASMAAALAYFFLHIGSFPELYLIPVKGLSLLLLAVFVWIRHPSGSAKILAGAMVVAAVAQMVLDVHVLAGHAIYFAFYLIVLGLFIHNRREHLTVSQTRAAVALLIMTPFILHLVTQAWLGTAVAAAYGLALGAMAASAWASNFPRYRVGIGAVVIMAGSLLSMASITGPLQASGLVQAFIWPVSYLGHMLMCAGVVHRLRNRDPQLWLASHNSGSRH